MDASPPTAGGVTAAHTPAGLHGMILATAPTAQSILERVVAYEDRAEHRPTGLVVIGSGPRLPPRFRTLVITRAACLGMLQYVIIRASGDGTYLPVAETAPISVLSLTWCSFSNVASASK